MAKKKEKLPVFVLVEMPEWKNQVLRLVCRALLLKGNPWVITTEGTGFTTDGKSYTHEETGQKIDLPN
jgi:hypothetical protein